ncbi:MAG: hypothetical protein AABY88_08135 [Pseudomonadota bacterium]
MLQHYKADCREACNEIAAAALYPLGLSLPGSSIQTLRRATATYASGLPSTAPSTTLSIGNASMCALRLA